MLFQTVYHIEIFFTVGVEQVETTRNVKWWKCLNLKEGLLNHEMTCIGAATRKKVLCIFVPNIGKKYFSMSI